MKIKKEKQVRVRIAPSPTGVLHIGTVRAAFFNYLFSKKHKGKFVIRIEDTDKERSKKEYEKDILDGLKWLGIDWDEGPFRQSERGEVYKKYIQKLVDEKKVYYCFCSKEELDAQRQYLMSIGKPPRYDGKCHEFTEKEIAEHLKQKKPYVLRLKVPHKKIVFKDLLRGKIETDTDNFGDMVITKGIDQPLYNLAVVIDDYEMKISHVIRGEDHISNTPKQIVIAKALDIESPEYLHLPLILAPDKSKMSKRHGAVGVGEYQEQGYLPEALLNFLAFLGWNPGNNQEIFSLDQLIKEFSIEKIQKSGAIFNIQKLDWINGYYIRNMDLKELTKLCIPYLEKAKIPTKDSKLLEKAISLYHERLKKLSEIGELISPLFKEQDYDKELLIWKKASPTEVKSSLDNVAKLLSKINDQKWTVKNITDELMKEADRVGDRGLVLWPLRVALSNKKASAGPFEIAEFLGQKETIKRIKTAIKKLS